ncbi:ricin-type beta-trefoil lectin domain protein [Microbacterium sp. NPDC090007]|uniref:ricin-type beta-trefoil lectin domain protein n=1 Tax=Microbacterium sp. NPDC090007 TaxID=3364204 RepID=UPI003828A7FD
MLTAERMKRPMTVGSVIAALLVSVGVVAAPVIAPAASAADTALYVSPTGNDGADGSLGAPFRTIERARDVVRTMNAGMSGDITVYLRGGSYPVDSTITFGVSDSGTNGHKVIYSAYQNEVPVLEAGTPITGWAPHSGNIWKAPLDRADKLRALYVDGQRAVMAKKVVNSTGCYGTYNITAGQAPWAWESGSECDGATYSLNDVPAVSRNARDMELQTQTTWTTAITGIRQVTTTPDGSQRAVLFQQPGAAIAQGAFNGDLQSGGTHTLSNAYEFLDEPGEFFYDRAAKTVYLYKGANTDLSSASVVAPDNVETILAVAGTGTANRAHDLVFTGLSFQHSDWNLAQIDGSSFKQAQQGNLVNLTYNRKNFHDYVYRNVQLQPGAIEVDNAAGIEFVGNRVEHTGSDGIQFNNDVVDSRIDGNVTNDVAGSGINIGDPQHVYIGDGTSSNGEHYPAGVEGAPTDISVRNNYVYDSAVLFFGSAAITGYFLDTVAIENNRIDKTSWAGISMGWGWGNFDGTSGSNAPGKPSNVARGNSIQRNEIRDTMRFLSDSGPLYTLGDQKTSVISENYANGVRPGHTYGIHPDEGSANISYDDNVMEIDPGVTDIIHSGTWGRQNNLQIRNTFGPTNSIFDKNIPNSVVEDVRVSGDFVWPAQAYDVTVASGIEPSYRGILGTIARTADFAMPSSVIANDSTTTVAIRGVGDGSRRLWLAPAGTTSFTQGPTMTTAAGDATSIAVPQAKGAYTLSVVDANGSVASTSKATVVRTAPAPRTQAMTHVDAKKCLDVPGASRENGAQPGLWDCHGSNNQQFTYTPDEEIRVFGDKCLDAAGAGTTAGTRVIIWDCSGASNQKWTLNGNGTVTAKGSNLCLALTGSRTDNGAPAQLSTCTNATNQRWTFPIAQATVPQNATVVLNDAQRCLDVPAASTQNGTRTALWTCSGSVNQRFTYTAAGELRVFGNKCLDALYNGTTDGSAVGIWDCNGGTNQKWTLDGSGTITSRSAGLCLATSGSRTDNGGPTQLSSCSGGSVQRWTVRG